MPDGCWVRSNKKKETEKLENKNCAHCKRYFLFCFKYLILYASHAVNALFVCFCFVSSSPYSLCWIFNFVK